MGGHEHGHMIIMPPAIPLPKPETYMITGEAWVHELSAEVNLGTALVEYFSLAPHQWSTPLQSYELGQRMNELRQRIPLAFMELLSFHSTLQTPEMLSIVVNCARLRRRYAYNFDSAATGTPIHMPV